MQYPEHAETLIAIGRLARACADPLASAALDLGAAALGGDPDALCDRLGHVLALVVARRPAGDDQVAHVALACAAGALQRDGLLVSAGVRLLIQHHAISTADLLETVGLRLGLEAAVRGNPRVEQAASRVQTAAVIYAKADDKV